MSWLRIDDAFAENEKVAKIGDRAFRLHVTALCYCARNLTDGLLTDRTIRVVSAAVTHQKTTRNIAELVAAGLWVQGDREGEYEIKDYLVYNPAAEKVKEEREKARKRMAGRRSSGDVRENTDANFTGTFREGAGTPTHPIPSLTENQKPGGDDRKFKNLDPLSRLVDALDDASGMTLKTISKLCAGHSFSEGDFEAAREAALGPGVKSRSAVAIAKLRERAA